MMKMALFFSGVFFCSVLKQLDLKDEPKNKK